MGIAIDINPEGVEQRSALKADRSLPMSESLGLHVAPVRYVSNVYQREYDTPEPAGGHPLP
jgi:hypothetical protein